MRLFVKKIYMSRDKRRDKVTVTEWDEYGQGYDDNARLLVCVCGERRADGDWSDHFCPYDEYLNREREILC